MANSKVPSVGDEIKQRKFRNEYQKALLNLLVTANKLYASNNRFLKTYGLSQEQYNVLRILRGQYPETSSVLNIQERMMDKMSNASRLVDKLELKNLLTRKQCPTDRRQVEILLTEKGLNILKEIDEPISILEAKLTSIPEEEMEKVNAILDQIRFYLTEEDSTQ